MPIYRPACLRPLLKRTEYRQLAERVNAAAGWPLLTWELLVFVTVSLLAPPLAPYIMVSIVYTTSATTFVINVYDTTTTTTTTIYRYILLYLHT